MQDYYSTLGVSRDADEVVIKAAYRALAQKYHPDRQNSLSQRENARLMSEINIAYSVLGDADKRKEYDNKQLNHQLKKATQEKAYPSKSQEKHKVNEDPNPKLSNLQTNIIVLAMWVIGFYFIFSNIAKK